MKLVRVLAAALSLLLLHGTSSIAAAAVSPSPNAVRGAMAASASRELDFRLDDAEAQSIARKLLAKQLADEERYTAEAPTLRTAWVKSSPSP